MASHKFHALADQVRNHRVEHLNQIHSRPRRRRYIARTQQPLSERQIPLSFMGENRSLEIFHQFDAEARQIDWSYYTQDGEFLLQFGFCLNRQEYEVFAVHPGLFFPVEAMKLYRKAIEETLGRHLPALTMVKLGDGKVEIQRKDRGEMI